MTNAGREASESIAKALSILAARQRRRSTLKAVAFIVWFAVAVTLVMHIWNA